jgi:hypothetical protein
VSLGAPVERVVSLLTASGYRALDQPFTVGGIPFEFDAVLAGKASLDLIAIVDTVIDADPNRVRARVEGLSRALDLARSRRPLTVILVGPPPGLPLTHALARVSRVLAVGTPTGGRADAELGDALAVLLPLELTTEDEGAPESWAGVRQELQTAHLDSATESVLEASELGSDAVREALRRTLAAPFIEEKP